MMLMIGALKNLCVKFSLQIILNNRWVSIWNNHMGFVNSVSENVEINSWNLTAHSKQSETKCFWVNNL